jgi:hypothetical protein
MRVQLALLLLTAACLAAQGACAATLIASFPAIALEQQRLQPDLDFQAAASSYALGMPAACTRVLILV